MVGLNLFDKNGKEIALESKLKDSQGVYVVRLGSLNGDSAQENCDDPIAYGLDGETEKVLWPERASQFELIDDK